jgi:hypothetical protein
LEITVAFVDRDRAGDFKIHFVDDAAIAASLSILESSRSNLIRFSEA